MSNSATEVAASAAVPDTPVEPNLYWKRLAERCETWGKTHPEQYAELVAQTKALCDIPATLPDDMIKPAKRRVLDAIVHESIRIKNGWPGEDQWLAQQRVRSMQGAAQEAP